ncbi:hypothetical protein KA082_03290 [Candidatus Woesebacteria bacterium]|nr:hypothetical protein [Candidatus Woesebacteria bacterium]
MSLMAPSTAYAALSPSGCPSGVSVTSQDFNDNYSMTDSKTITFKVSGISSAFRVSTYNNSKAGATHLDGTVATSVLVNPTNGSGTAVLEVPHDNSSYTVRIDQSDYTKICSIGNFSVSGTGSIICDVTVKQTRKINNVDTACYLGKNKTGCLETSVPVEVNANITDSTGKPLSGAKVDVTIGNTFGWQQEDVDDTGHMSTSTFVVNDAGDYAVNISVDKWFVNTVKCNSVPFSISLGCYTNGQPNCSTDPSSTSTTGIVSNPDTKYQFNLCKQISNQALQGKCLQCETKQGIWTAVGCIESKPQNIVKRVIEVGLGLGGGVCLLMTLIGGFYLTISQGDTAQVNEAKAMITSAIYGLLFIIFSVFILQFIGVTILHIPGFGTT